MFASGYATPDFAQSEFRLLQCTYASDVTCYFDRTGAADIDSGVSGAKAYSSTQCSVRCILSARADATGLHRRPDDRLDSVLPVGPRYPHILVCWRAFGASLRSLTVTLSSEYACRTASRITPSRALLRVFPDSLSGVANSWSANESTMQIEDKPYLAFAAVVPSDSPQPSPRISAGVVAFSRRHCRHPQRFGDVRVEQRACSLPVVHARRARRACPRCRRSGSNSTRRSARCKMP